MRIVTFRSLKFNLSTAIAHEWQFRTPWSRHSPFSMFYEHLLLFNVADCFCNVIVRRIHYLLFRVVKYLRIIIFSSFNFNFTIVELKVRVSINIFKKIFHFLEIMLDHGTVQIDLGQSHSLWKAKKTLNKRWATAYLWIWINSVSVYVYSRVDFSLCTY